MLKKTVIIVVVCALFCMHAAAAECVVARVPNAQGKIALTFDDGPHPQYTAQILDILKEFGVKATFFVIGTNAEKLPELVEREMAEGHEVANHTYDHVYLKKVTDKEIQSEVTDSEAIITGIINRGTKLIRPPGGIYDDRLISVARDGGYKIILWSVDTRDWSVPPVQSVIDEVVKRCHSGDIILMHDYICSSKPSPSPEALRTISPQLKEKGFEFVTVSELLETK